MQNSISNSAQNAVANTEPPKLLEQVRGENSA